jgi:tetratricopeptide (TPR) repeat protein
MSAASRRTCTYADKNASLINDTDCDATFTHMKPWSAGICCQLQCFNKILIIKDMKKLIFLFLLLINIMPVVAQDNTLTPANDSLILSDADEIPEYTGGDSALLNFIITQLTDNKIILPKGTVLSTVNIQFIVTDSGNVKKVKVAQGTNNIPDLDKSIINIFEMMPNWKPAKNNGAPANFLFFIGLTIFNKSTTYRETKFHQFDSIRFKINLTNISKMNHLKAKEDFYYNSGVKKSQMKDYQGAIDDFTEALKYNPQDIDALYNRALLRLTLNDLTGACADWNLIKSLEKQDADEFIKKYCN